LLELRGALRQCEVCRFEGKSLELAEHTLVITDGDLIHAQIEFLRVCCLNCGHNRLHERSLVEPEENEDDASD
jgi:hypothetical protein